jgi:hypothetical protein
VETVAEKSVQWLIEPFNDKTRNVLYDGLKDQYGKAEGFRSKEGLRFEAWPVPNFRFVRHMISRKKQDSELKFEIWRVKDKGSPENVTDMFMTKKLKLARNINREIKKIGRK